MEIITYREFVERECSDTGIELDKNEEIKIELKDVSFKFDEDGPYILKNINEYHPSVILCVPLLLENMHKNIIKNMNKTLPKKYVTSQNENPFDKLPSPIKHIVKS